MFLVLFPLISPPTKKKEGTKRKKEEKHTITDMDMLYFQQIRHSSFEKMIYSPQLNCSLCVPAQMIFSMSIQEKHFNAFVKATREILNITFHVLQDGYNKMLLKLFNIFPRHSVPRKGGERKHFSK